MAKRGLYIFLALIYCLPSLVCQSQDLNGGQPEDSSLVTSKVLRESKVTIRQIIVTGNKKTKEHIVKREVPFLEGQSYPMSDILASLPKAGSIL